MKKKWIIVALLALIFIITILFWLSRWEWREISGSDGYFSEDTYVEDGYGDIEIGAKYRFVGDYAINSGTCTLQIMDDKFNVLFSEEINSGHIEIDYDDFNLPEGTYVEHYDICGDKIDISIKDSVIKKMYNYDIVMQHIKEFYHLNILGEEHFD